MLFSDSAFENRAVMQTHSEYRCSDSHIQQICHVVGADAHGLNVINNSFHTPKFSTIQQYWSVYDVYIFVDVLLSGLYLVS